MSKVLRTAWGYKSLVYSYAQMYPYGMINIASGESLVPTDYRSGEQYGEFQCDIANGKIVIPAHSADYVRLSGQICGNGNVQCWLTLYDENDKSIVSSVCLYQPNSSGYGAAPIPSKIVKIPDKSKSYYAKLTIRAYNHSFYFNEGFGNTASYMCVEKVI